MGIKRRKKFNILFLLKNIVYYLLLIFILFGYFIKKEFNNVCFEQLLFTLKNPEGGNFDIVYRGIIFVFGISTLIFLIIFSLKILILFSSKTITAMFSLFFLRCKASL